jgi:hypothetical protein
MEVARLYKKPHVELTVALRLHCTPCAGSPGRDDADAGEAGGQGWGRQEVKSAGVVGVGVGVGVGGLFASTYWSSFKF